MIMLAMRWLRRLLESLNRMPRAAPRLSRRYRKIPLPTGLCPSALDRRRALGAVALLEPHEGE